MQDQIALLQEEINELESEIDEKMSELSQLQADCDSNYDATCDVRITALQTEITEATEEKSVAEMTVAEKQAKIAEAQGILDDGR